MFRVYFNWSATLSIPPLATVDRGTGGRNPVECARLGERDMKIVRAVLFAAFIAFGTTSQVHAAGSSCESLLRLTLQNATVTSAAVVPAGGFRAPGSGAAAENASRFADLPAF